VKRWRVRAQTSTPTLPPRMPGRRGKSSVGDCRRYRLVLPELPAQAARFHRCALGPASEVAFRRVAASWSNCSA